MKLPVRKLHDRFDRLEERIRVLVAHRSAAGGEFARYVCDPIGFARDVLKVTPTADHERWLPALLEPPYRVMAKSGHKIGKTFGAAMAVAWWHYTRPQSVVITTAPTERDVIDLLWTEIRLLVTRARLPDHFIGPAAPEMFESEEHWAKGYTARKGESFQGRHRANMLFVFDEAEGIEGTYWKVTNTMFKPGAGHAWLSILNPTTTTSQSYQEEQATDAAGNPKWRTFSVSSLDHPNVAVGLANRGRAERGEPLEPEPVPNAVGLEQVEGWLAEWFEPVAPDEVDDERDVEFPPGSGQWHRPSPDGEGRVLGRRPTAGTFGVWSERLWQLATAGGLEPAADDLPELGCDVARFGDDRTEIHSRCGPCSLAHEDHGGWDTVRTANRLMTLADQLAKWATKRRPPQAAPVDPKTLAIKIDDTGVGGGVTDILVANGYNAVPVNSGEAAPKRDKYPKVRDQLWFDTAGRARRKQIDLSRLSPKVRARLRVQFLAPKWSQTHDRKRQVESKEALKKPARLGKSPDGADSVNLAYFEVATSAGAEVVDGGGKRANWRDRSGR